MRSWQDAFGLSSTHLCKEEDIWELTEINFISLFTGASNGEAQVDLLQITKAEKDIGSQADSPMDLLLKNSKRSKDPDVINKLLESQALR